MVIDLVERIAPGTKGFGLVVLEGTLAVGRKKQGGRKACLAFKIYGGRADKVAVVVSLLHGRRGFSSHHGGRRAGQNML